MTAILALALVLLPLAMGGLAFAVPSDRRRPWLLPVTGLGELALVVLALATPDVSAANGWIVLDEIGRVVLGLLGVLFFLCSIYAVGYLRGHADRPNRLFCATLHSFFAMMVLVVLSRHLGLLWVAMEAATLSCGPLLYYARNRRSLEATWKYLMVGSVGIALALLGSFFLAYSAFHSGLPTSLLIDDLIREAPRLSRPWLHAAFVFLFVGYGTKMGLAPMHTWKPDAYGEAPGLVGALLAGGLTNCAFLAIVRFYRIAEAAGEGPFAREILTVMGLGARAAGGLFMLRQRDLKRLLAYSSVEHMGILVLGLGLGGAAAFGTLFHVVNNGLAKGVMFLAAGNLHRSFGSKNLDQVSGAIRVRPLTGWLFLVGFLAVTGTPPFAPFHSEFAILCGAMEGGRFLVATLYLTFLSIAFMGMGTAVLAVVQGRPSQPVASLPREGFLETFPVLVLAGLVLLLGVYVPAPLAKLLGDGARLLGAP